MMPTQLYGPGLLYLLCMCLQARLYKSVGFDSQLQMTQAAVSKDCEEVVAPGAEEYAQYALHLNSHFTRLQEDDGRALPATSRLLACAGKGSWGLQMSTPKLLLRGGGVLALCR